MRLILATRHRRVVILTGDDAVAEEDPGVVVQSISGDTQLAPEAPWDDRMEPYEDHFGF